VCVCFSVVCALNSYHHRHCVCECVCVAFKITLCVSVCVCLVLMLEHHNAYFLVSTLVLKLMGCLCMSLSVSVFVLVRFYSTSIFFPFMRSYFPSFICRHSSSAFPFSSFHLFIFHLFRSYFRFPFLQIYRFVSDKMLLRAISVSIFHPLSRKGRKKVLHSIKQENSPRSQNSEIRRNIIENSVSDASPIRSRNNEFEINLMMKFYHSAHAHDDLKNPYREGFLQLFQCRNENFELLGILLLFYQSAGLLEKNCTASNLSTFDALDGVDGGEEGEGEGAGAEWGDVSGGKAEKENMECSTKNGLTEGTGGEIGGGNGADWGNGRSKEERNGKGPWTGGEGVGIYGPGSGPMGPVLELPGVNAVIVLRAMGVLPLRSDARTDTDSSAIALCDSFLSGGGDIKGEAEREGGVEDGGKFGVDRGGLRGGVQGNREGKQSQSVACLLEGNREKGEGGREGEIGGEEHREISSCKTDITSDSSPLSDISPNSPHRSCLHPTIGTAPGPSVPLPLSLPPEHPAQHSIPSLSSPSTVSLPHSSTPSSSSAVPPMPPSTPTTSSSSYPTLHGVKWLEEIEEEARENIDDERSLPLPQGPSQGPIRGRPEGEGVQSTGGTGETIDNNNGNDDDRDKYDYDKDHNSNQETLNLNTPNSKENNYNIKMHYSNVKKKGAVQLLTEETDDIENPSEEKGLSSLEPDVMSVYKLFSISEYFHGENLQYENKDNTVVVRNTRIGINKYETKDQFDLKNGIKNEVENEKETEVENIFANCIGNNFFVDMDTDLDNTVSDVIAVTPEQHTVEYGEGGEDMGDSCGEKLVGKWDSRGVKGGEMTGTDGERERELKGEKNKEGGSGQEAQGEGEGEGERVGQSSDEGVGSDGGRSMSVTSTRDSGSEDKHSNSNSISDNKSISDTVTPTLQRPISLPLSAPSSLHLSIPMSPSSSSYSSSSFFRGSISDDVVFSVLSHGTRHSMVCIQVKHNIR
jgi:hypothetical protein